MSGWSTRSGHEPDAAHVQVLDERELRASTGLGRALRDAMPLLVAVALLMAGNGLTSTLLGVRAGLEGFNAAVTGVVLSGFYLGFLVGSLVTPRTIWRVGHVRVFAGLASLASAAVLVHVIRPDPWSWFTLRAISGLCLSGLYVVTETWLNGAATNRTRGGLLAGYMVVVTGSLGAGQLLFSVADPGGYAAFVLASVLVSIAVVPVSLASVSTPEVLSVQHMSYRELCGVAPLGVLGAGIAGFSGAAMVGGGGAVYAAGEGLGRGEISLLLFAALAGGLILQVPLGRWSDTTDRRRVLAAAAGLGACAAVAAAFVGSDSIPLLALLGGLAGGTSFALYSLANAHLYDWLDEEQVVAAGAGMVLVYGMGAVAGPVAVASAIDLSGPTALFVMLAASYTMVGGYAVWRTFRRAAVAEEDRASFAAVPAGTAPTVATLAEAVPEALHPDPAEAREVATDHGSLAYLVQGSGPAVVLAAVEDVVEWGPVLPAFAANGLRAVGIGLRLSVSPDDSEESRVEDLLAVLRELDLASATMVGVADACGVVARFVADHPERTDGVVLVGPFASVHRDRSELAERHLLVLTGEPPSWEDPVLFADAVADFIRHTVLA